MKRLTKRKGQLIALDCGFFEGNLVICCNSLHDKTVLHEMNVSVNTRRNYVLKFCAKYFTCCLMCTASVNTDTAQ